MLATGISLALRADGWNTYCVSTVPYPSTTILPKQTEADGLLQGLMKLFPTGKWAWSELPLHIGMALELRQSPKDPRLVARTTAVLHTLMNKFAGPPQARLKSWN